jgi:RNA polymerase-binding transcription factor DksA
LKLRFGVTPFAIDLRQRLVEHRSLLMLALANDDPRESLRADLTETEAALGRIADGSYGRCEACTGAIGRQRLLALPTARYCIECAPQTKRGRR